MIGTLILLVLRFRPQGLIPEPRPRDLDIETAESRAPEAAVNA